MVTKNSLKKLAVEKIKILFNEAKLNPSKADRYVDIARKISMKVNLSMPKEFRRKYCKHCYSYFVPGKFRVRTRNKMVIYYCLKCKKYMKFKIPKTI